MKPLPTTSTRPRGTRSHAAQDTGERLDVRPAGVVDRVRKLDPPGGPNPLGETAGHDRRLGEPLAGRLVPRQAAATGAAPGVMDEGYATPVAGPGHDLVPEHGALGPHADLLHVRPAEPAREHGHELAGRRRFGDLGEAGLPVGA